MYQTPEDWRSFYEAMAVELPLGFQHLLAGASEAEIEIEQASSKAHHAWVNLASSVVNTIYVRTGFWDVMLDGLNAAIRVQQLAQALAKVCILAFGPAVGIAPVSEIDAIHDELRRLRQDFSAITATLESNGQIYKGHSEVK